MFPVHLDTSYLEGLFVHWEVLLDQKHMIQPGDDIKWEKSHIMGSV